MKSFNNYSLLNHNTFGINATCQRFVEYENVEELKGILCHEVGVEKKYIHIGSGSNLLFTKDFEGVVLHSAILGKNIVREDEENVVVRVGAGEIWDDLVAWCVKQGLYGLENLSYIPGEVGAAAVQNIGAYGSEIAEFINQVHAVGVKDGKDKTFSRKECKYAYRKSVFKTDLKGEYVVTYVDLVLSRNFCPDLSYAALKKEIEHRCLSERQLTASVLRELVVDIRKGKLPEPSEIGSAGSFFMNPVVDSCKAEHLLQHYPNMPQYPVDNGIKIPAGWLIEQCGWKGQHLGPAGVYEKQALVLVNLGGATGQDICRLSKTIQLDVKAKFDVDIYPEVNFI